MPWSASFDAQANLARGAMSGVVSAQDLLDATEWLLGLPAASSAADERWDCTGVTDIQMDFADIAGVADLERSQRVLIRPVRNAILVANPASFGFARMYASLVGDDTTRTIRVFYDATEADAWLAGGDDSLGLLVTALP